VYKASWHTLIVKRAVANNSTTFFSFFSFNDIYTLLEEEK
jgi:hypothetical protein